MPFSNKFKEKNSQQILREALFFTGKNFPRLLLLFIIPFTIINITAILSTIDPTTLFKKNKIEPFTIFLSEQASKECKLVNVTQKATPYKAGWLRIEKIDRTKKITVTTKNTNLTIDPKKSPVVWIYNKKINKIAPASFYTKEPNSIIIIIQFIFSILLQLFLFSWLLLNYFNRPPVTYKEIFQLAKNNFINFAGLYALLIIIIFLIPALINPLARYIILFIALARFSLAPCTTLTEGLKPIAALKRSIQLSQTQLKRFILFTAVITISSFFLFFISTLITEIIFGLPAKEITKSIFTNTGNGSYFWPLPFFAIYAITIFITSTLLPIICYYLYSVYMDIRIRKEGLHNKSKEGFFDSQTERTEE